MAKSLLLVFAVAGLSLCDIVDLEENRKTAVASLQALRKTVDSRYRFLSYEQQKRFYQYNQSRWRAIENLRKSLHGQKKRIDSAIAKINAIEIDKNTTEVEFEKLLARAQLTDKEIAKIEDVVEKQIELAPEEEGIRLVDQGDSTEADSPVVQQPKKSKKSEKAEKLEKAVKAEKEEKVERLEKLERAEKARKGKKTGRSTKIQRGSGEEVPVGLSSLALAAGGVADSTLSESEGAEALVASEQQDPLGLNLASGASLVDPRLRGADLFRRIAELEAQRAALINSQRSFEFAFQRHSLIPDSELLRNFQRLHPELSGTSTDLLMAEALREKQAGLQGDLASVARARFRVAEIEAALLRLANIAAQTQNVDRRLTESPLGPSILAALAKLSVVASRFPYARLFRFSRAELSRLSGVESRSLAVSSDCGSLSDACAQPLAEQIAAACGGRGRCANLLTARVAEWLSQPEKQSGAHFAASEPLAEFLLLDTEPPRSPEAVLPPSEALRKFLAAVLDRPASPALLSLITKATEKASNADKLLLATGFDAPERILTQAAELLMPAYTERVVF